MKVGTQILLPGEKLHRNKRPAFVQPDQNMFSPGLLGAFFLVIISLISLGLIGYSFLM